MLVVEPSRNDAMKATTLPAANESERRSTVFSAPTRFLARQPILDARRHVVGHELLFRSGWETAFRDESGNATHRMVDHCVALGIEELADGGLAFVNCTREALVSGLVTLLPPASTVLEILETVEPDSELVAACHSLRDRGYRFALDDYLPRVEMQPLIELADFVKVDFRLADAPTRSQIVRQIRGSQAMLLAEKIEDQAEFDMALAEGYRYFQGYFFCRPKLIADQEIPPNRVNFLRLLVELARMPLNLREVTRIVESEASLCYRLLRLANSAFMGVRAEVTSVQEAMVLIGDDRFRTLVSVALSSAMGSDQPPALIRVSLEHARFCELLAPWLGENPTEQYMLGLLSLLDAILQTPMTKIVQSLPLRRSAKAALLGETGGIAAALDLIRSFEAGSWGSCASVAEGFGMTEESLAQVYMDSLRWAANAVALAG
jgi:c-di-GMP-related signal transduction protein